MNDVQFNLLNIPSILAQLQTQTMGRKISYFHQLNSTQTKAHELVAQGAEEGTVIIAEQQTEGRGRMGRGWFSPAGKGLWFSMVLKPNIPMRFVSHLTLLISVALCRTLQRLYSIDVKIKWPNDLIVNGKKLSGILLEKSNNDDRSIIAGVGISVNFNEEDYPEELRDIATSLRMVVGHEVSREELLCAFLSEWDQCYALYHEQGFAFVRTTWEALSVNLHRPIVIQTAQGRIEGISQGLDEHGALLVTTSDGRQEKILSGDVIRF